MPPLYSDRIYHRHGNFFRKGGRGPKESVASAIN